MIILKIRENKFFKTTVFLLIAQLLTESLGYNYALAGDGGPTQPEVHSFEPIGTTQMVDPFSGDLTYNIPLFNLPGPNGGYPVNLAYHSGIQMDQEASWVGLGWNINMGTISRQVRNLPDDFDQDVVKIKTDQKPNWTVGTGLKMHYELFGYDAEALASAASISAGVNYYYNNYRGFGYSTDFGLSLKMRKLDEFGQGSKLAGDLGFNVKIDTREGISGNVTAGISQMDEPCNNKTKKSLGVSTGFNQNGWQRSIIIQGGLDLKRGKAKTNSSVNKQNMSGGNSLSFTQPLISITTPQSMKGGSGMFDFNAGFNVAGNLVKLDFSVNYELSKLKNKNREIEYKGIGYLYYQNGGTPEPEDDLRVKDISVENEGLVHKDTRRLAIPTLTYDNYSVTGQGIGNSFRPHRADIGNAETPYVHSEFHGGSLGFEIAPPVFTNIRLGMDLGYSFSGSTVRSWPTGSVGASFTTTDAALMNSTYFKVYGDHAHDDLQGNYGTRIASNTPLAYAISEEDNFYELHNLDQQGNTIISNSTRTTRRKRAEDIEPYTNATIMDEGYSTALIPEFALNYYNSSSSGGYNKLSGSLMNYDEVRASLPKSHVGGYMATNSDGLRYVYALPAQSKKERDVTFSVAETPSMIGQTNIDADPENYKLQGTNKYYNSVEKGTYAHSYMLTSILGEDYVDLDNVKGASDGDLGYWVKFNYFKAYDNFKWKSPYQNVNYSKGYKTNFKDGTANYSYGEKEIWYVATVETKTHVAEFILLDRDDCKEPGAEVGNTAGSNSYKKLDKINIYLKSERYPNGTFNGSARPIQTCNFEYYDGASSLCKGSPDNPTGGGKLTLKKVWFTYRNNSTGATNPYIFEYNKTVGGTEITYNKFAVDKWGNYKPFTNMDDPYTDPYTSKAVMDERASLWNLKAINLPSGGRYEIDYESDTYAYVQNEVAMQMFKIASMSPYNEAIDVKIDSDKNAGAATRRVYFKLETPISQSLTDPQTKDLMQKYIREGEYLYFKVDINLTKATDTKETVGGYARVNDINVDESSLVGSDYQWGYVELEPLKVNGQSTEYHPFTEVGARHIRYNQPDILVDNLPGADMDDLNKSTAKSIATSMISTIPTLAGKFKKYTESLYKDGDDRLSEIDLDKSFLRMRTPDKVKFGGGHRVKEVRIYDNWADAFTTGGTELSSVYGTVYEYDMTDATGNKISSGVATYEPLVGGDENPFRNPVKGWEDKNILAKNVANTYSEDPGNESIFPGASVGYSQVRIMSKNTAAKKSDFSGSVIQHYGGVTVQEFFTAKDFPIINKVTELEQNKTFRKSRLIVPAVFANVDRLRMAATQGYYTELNDMHGKPKGAKELALVAADNTAQYDEQLISSVEYDYFDEEKLTTNRAGETFITRTLKNEVDILFSDTDPNDLTKAKISSGTLATDIEFIPRTQYINKKNISGALSLNFEAFAPLALLYPIPSFNWQEEKVGTVVTNKIVSKSGLVSKVTAIQKGSKIETENLVFDDLTGAPLLTTVTNDYGDKIYNYSILARDIYDRTGAAYQNIGKTAYLTTPTALTNGIQEITLETSGDVTKFVKGDHLLLIPVVPLNGSAYYVQDFGRPKLLARYADVIGNNLKLEVAQAMTGTLYQAVVIQSGRKNNLTMPVSSITALSNPTILRTVIDCHDSSPGVGDLASFKMRKINNVIGISSTELGEYWYKDTRQITEIPSNWYDNALYSKGFGGNFNPIRNYAYIADRTQSTNVNLKIDGVMNDVPLFNFESILVQPSSEECKSKWRLTDQITLMNPSSNAVESKNILNTYTASLYGRNGIEPIAIAGNAKNAEIGFESFEEYTTTSVDIDVNSTNNLNFYSTNTNTGAVQMENRFDIKGSGASGIMDVPASFLLSEYNSYVVRIHFDAFNNDVAGVPTFYPKQERLVRLNASDLTVTTVSGQKVIQFNQSTNLFNIPEPYRRNWRGEIFLGKVIPNPGASGPVNSVVVSTGKGHTGDKSLKVYNEAAFLQRRLNLVEGKEYQFSGWFSTENNHSLQTLYTDNSNYFTQPFRVEFLDASNALMPSNTLTYKETDIMQGTFIDEWQKFTLNFTMPTGAKYARIILPRAKEVEVGAGNFQQYALFDDLRVQPRDAGMSTYVYNNENQRLEAELDENNYATFYYYDGEGQLFLVKRETEKGIITVQESRSSLKRD